MRFDDAARTRVELVTCQSRVGPNFGMIPPRWGEHRLGGGGSPGESWRVDGAANTSRCAGVVPAGRSRTARLRGSSMGRGSRIGCVNLHGGRRATPTTITATCLTTTPTSPNAGSGLWEYSVSEAGCRPVLLSETGPARNVLYGESCDESHARSAILLSNVLALPTGILSASDW